MSPADDEAQFSERPLPLNLIGLVISSPPLLEERDKNQDAFHGDSHCSLFRSRKTSNGGSYAFSPSSREVKKLNR